MHEQDEDNDTVEPIYVASGVITFAAYKRAAALLSCETMMIGVF
jgi:hypothetical protein